jgi:hypothetical protein
MEKTYSVYDDISKQFIATTGKGKVYLTHGKGYNRDNIARWSLSKARNVVKNYKRMNWLYDHENGNPTRKALRILRVYSNEWSELTGIWSMRVTIRGTRISSYGDWY